MSAARVASRIGLPVLVGAILLGAWFLLVDVAHALPRAVPSPAAVGEQLALHLDIIWGDVLVTGLNALVGLVVGAVFAILWAGLAARFAPVDGMLAPLVAAIAVVPIVSLTPILNGLFNGSSEFSRQAVAAIAAFVPVFVNVLRGLRQTQAVQRDLFHALAATGGQVFRSLTLPTAIPHLMTGLRIASSLAVISALVAEYFGGPADGLGTAIATYAKAGKAALAWGYVGGAIVLGLVLFLVTGLLERLVSRRTTAG